MKIIGLGAIHSFQQLYPNSKSWLNNWIADTRDATWKTSHDVKARYPSCSFLPDNHVVFNVCGNNYRMEVLIAYNTGTIAIERVETHSDYTRRNKSKQRFV